MASEDFLADLDLLIYIHDQIIEASGGSKGIHDEKLLKSALARPFHSAFGEDAYGDIFFRAAALLDSLANNHGFRDGNKRTAMRQPFFISIPIKSSCHLPISNMKHLCWKL